VVISKILEPQGYVVTLCSDGQEALDTLQRRTYLPDLILLDSMMPRISGIEVAQRIRLMFPQVAVPIIMVSARSKEEHIVEGLCVGCNDYVTKPFKAKELLARIDSHLKNIADWRSELHAVALTTVAKQLLPERVIERIARV
jgi:DNA-binding response OmpR family regulator